MERKIGEEFTFEGDVLLVVANDCDDIAFFRRGIVACNRRCVFCKHGRCTGVLRSTGDCQKRYREDNRHVFFEDAAFARSPLGAAAANSAKIQRKSCENPTRYSNNCLRPAYVKYLSLKQTTEKL